MPKDNPMRQFGKYYGLAFLVPVSILVGYTIGYFLDKAFGTQYLKVVFLFSGHRVRYDRACSRTNQGRCRKVKPSFIPDSSAASPG
jgi:hypothetical protein